MQIIKLEQYNEQAIKTFLGAMIKILPLPQFIWSYKMQQWDHAYAALEQGLGAEPERINLIVATYNKAYNLVLTQNN